MLKNLYTRKFRNIYKFNHFVHMSNVYWILTIIHEKSFYSSSLICCYKSKFTTHNCRWWRVLSSVFNLQTFFLLNLPMPGGQSVKISTYFKYGKFDSIICNNFHHHVTKNQVLAGKWKFPGLTQLAWRIIFFKY